MSVVGVYGHQRTGTWRLARSLGPACAAWLTIAAVGTLIALLERWPAQFGGKGDPARIHTQWLSKGTVLSPPAFLLVAMLVALALVMIGRSRTMTRVGATLAGIVSVTGIVGSLGELLAAATPAVPTGAKDAAIIGVLFSAAVLIAAIACLYSPAVSTDRR